MTAFRIGFAVSDITPRIGTPLGGYIGRPRFEAQGVHDPLFAKAIACSDDETLLLAISVDLLGFSPERSSWLVQQVADCCGLEPGQVLIACTHTHSGPNTLPLRGMPSVGDDYFEALAQKMRLAGKAALAAQRPARMEAAIGRSRVGVNRRSRAAAGTELLENPEGVFDDALLVLRFTDDQSGQPLGLVSSYGCHLTALGPRNMLVSAEWAGLAMATLEERLHCPCVFFNGAFGNVNPRGRDETWARTEEIAAAFAADCLHTLGTVQPASATPIRGERLVLELPLAPLAPEDTIHRLRIESVGVLSDPLMDDVSRRVAQVRREYADAVERRRIACEIEETRPAELVGIRLGDVVGIGVPGEIFAEYAIWVRGDSPFPYTMVLGNVGAEMGYLPTATAFAEGGYEPTSHVYFCEQGYAATIEDELLVAARTLLARLSA
jgi:neutral ceramidase